MVIQDCGVAIRSLAFTEDRGPALKCEYRVCILWFESDKVVKSLDPVLKQGKWQFYFTGTRSGVTLWLQSNVIIIA